MAASREPWFAVAAPERESPDLGFVPGHDVNWRFGRCVHVHLCCSEPGSTLAGQKFARMFHLRGAPYASGVEFLFLGDEATRPRLNDRPTCRASGVLPRRRHHIIDSRPGNTHPLLTGMLRHQRKVHGHNVVGRLQPVGIDCGLPVRFLDILGTRCPILSLGVLKNAEAFFSRFPLFAFGSTTTF